MSDSDEIDELEDLTGTHYKRLHSFGFSLLRVAFFPSTDKMWQNPISGNFEIFLINPSKGKLRVALTHTHKLRWLMFEGKTFYTNAKHLTHFQMAEMIGEPNPSWGVGGFMTQQMFSKIPADMDMRLWEQENATAVR